MPKYYVQSGAVRGIVDSFDEECAAVWAVHLAMRGTASSGSAPREDSNGPEGVDGEGMFLLDDFIRISQRGFDREDALEIDSHLAFIQWHRLTKAIDTLCDRMNEMWD